MKTGARASSRTLLYGIVITMFMLLSAGTVVAVWGTVADASSARVFLIAFIAAMFGLLVYALVRYRQPAAVARVSAPDMNLIVGVIEDSDCAVAITRPDGSLACVNRRFQNWFGGLPTPPALPLPEESRRRLDEARMIARRDGIAHLPGLVTDRGTVDVVLRAAGEDGAHLVWRFRQLRRMDGISELAGWINGESGRRFGGAGIMVALVDAEGRGIVANRAFHKRALGDMEAPPGWLFTDLLRVDGDAIRLAREARDSTPIHLSQVTFDGGEGDGATMFLMFDLPTTAIGGGVAQQIAPAVPNVQGLLNMLPLGLALADRDGRLLFMNDSFRRAAGIAPDGHVIYPSDLVVEDDKASVSDAVRRFASGRGSFGDLSVRLKDKGEESVALTIAATKGLGDAAVLLSLKDNSEESRLKRQVAQAMKMQAVGQLAGGVAHDFNNILTAIIGHCDLMSMRHMPGDSDYDDIQQIKQNSNRAAALTRQLLAFSRQQTLRPQILQLPDVISEISSLLRRLLGERVALDVSHGRNLQTVRADPGQLEQVIVNLAVNARDAMPDGGTLTIQTYGLSAADTRKLGIEIMPITEYVALRMSDTGTGIPPEIITKIFEPFFTTKEVGRGTGLGLSTVYGIVKQTGGFIFAESEVGKGTSFVIYLPVHEAEKGAAPAQRAVAKEPSTELWGTGTILLVEDEAMVRAVAERALSRQGYTVVTATNGEEGLEVLESGQEVDLVISDVVMPVMDGPAMVRAAREARADLPVIFMSGYAEEQLRKSIDIENIGFLPKPFSVQQICEAARDTLAAERAADK
ncbi:response regulator [Sphingomonas crocodyli]|uniref:histidine kinase n=2 Tax=Sphingomonas crocodyli TaxID=1979270 RepID=A0A437MC24_9SPHN|nr:response regulator [Sphingomonas crocodyli]